MKRFAPLAFALAAASTDAAALDLQRDYALSIAGIDIGDATLSIRQDGDRYSAIIDGDYRFLFWSGAAKIESLGKVEDGAFSPLAYNSRLVSSTREVTTAIAFANGGVADASFQSEPPFDPERFADRIPVEQEHLRGALDPVSAFLIPATSAKSACAGLLRIFSGIVRFDLQLKPEGQGEDAGNCSGAYRPVSGHRRKSDEVDRLRDDGLALRLFEIAPGLWAPERIGFRTMFGTLALTRKDG